MFNSPHPARFYNHNHTILASQAHTASAEESNDYDISQVHHEKARTTSMAPRFNQSHVGDPAVIAVSTDFSQHTSESRVVMSTSLEAAPPVASGSNLNLGARSQQTSAPSHRRMSRLPGALARASGSSGSGGF